jgi:putative tryptophan/tyrosine transport system substrate-binding protein
VRRRLLISMLGATVVAGLARAPASAQQTMKVPRVGVLTGAENDGPGFDAFRNGLRELGYIEGQTIILDFRFAKGNHKAMPALAEELTRVPVDVILTDNTSVALAALSVTRTLPIVIGFGFDPVKAGLAASLARPGGNVTGMTIGATELAGKRLELLQQAFPSMVRVTVLHNPSPSFSVHMLRATETAATVLGIEITELSAGTPDELRALRPEALSGADGLVVVDDSMFHGHRAIIVELAAAARVPAVYPEREYAQEGGLIAYGANHGDSFRRAAGYVDRILKGAKPGDLPINEESKFDFVVNLKTARSLGFSLPPSFLARADEVIE